ncbi:MAG: hypothetical protein R3D85_13745 [Paracoccaceae bacterium]
MTKLIALMNVIAWMGFWAFGYIALTATDLSQTQILIAAILAGIGFLSGMFTYIRICNVISPAQAGAQEES